MCVGNGLFFYFRDDGKLDIYYMVKRRYPVIKNNSSDPFVEWNEMNWKTSNVNGLRTSIFFNNMGWYLSVIGKLHSYECLIYIFTVKVEMALQLYLIKHCIIHGIQN